MTARINGIITCDKALKSCFNVPSGTIITVKIGAKSVFHDECNNNAHNSHRIDRNYTKIVQKIVMCEKTIDNRCILEYNIIYNI